LRVEFMRLGDTAEFSQYRNLEKLFLYDLVRVRHPRLGIDVTAEVNRIDWDCLRDRYASIELGSIRRDSAGSRFAPWQIPGLSSLGASVTTLTDLV